MPKEATAAVEVVEEVKEAPAEAVESTVDEQVEFMQEDDSDESFLDADLGPAEGKPEVDDVETEEAGEKPAAEAAPAEKEPPTAPAEPAAAPPATPQAQPEKVTVTPLPEPEPAPQITQEQVQERYQAWRKNAQDALAQHFALDQQTVELLEDDPGKIVELLPRMAANVYIESVQMATQNVMAQLPHAVRYISDQALEEQRAADTFFTSWPQLNREDERTLQILGRLGETFRKAYPSAPAEQFIQTVGAQAMVALQIPLQAANPAAPAQEPAPRQEPFRPAASGAPGSAAAKTTLNPIAAFDQEAFGRDDLDADDF